ncbi:cell division protein PerM [Actinacidiphila rubida]|uniref:cell division protein PerM n=1 Tax=Actinacidiphila rubida TaxID=310780 RepID=UPI000943B7E6|nr:DUF6350 family protein [Actinacidiphila rubida]
MTHTTDSRQAHAVTPRPHARWASERVSALTAGVAAAGLGLGVPAVTVLLLWIGSPYPDSGLGGALHLTAALWLLAQGAELVRTGTASGDPAPVALVPLLLSVVPAWLLYRGTSSAIAGERGGEDGAADAAGDSGDTRPDGGRSGADEPPDVRRAVTVAGWVLAGYLTVAAVAAAYASSGPIRVAPLSVPYVPLFAAVAVACGAWSGCGRPPLASWLPLPRGYAEEAAAALRAAAVGCGVLLGGGALLGGAALAWHGGAVAQTYGRLSGPGSGRIAVLLLAAALTPNLAVWAASYALGTGFCVGAGSVVAPAGASGYPLLPSFPLLAALPGTGGGGVLGWATLAVPAAAAGAVAWCAGGAGLGLWRTVRVTCGAALLHGVGLAVAAAWAGGALGDDVLATFGPTWWLTGSAAAAWVLALAVPGALALSWHVAHPAHAWRPRVPSIPRPALPALPAFRRAAPPPSPVPTPVPLPPPADPLPWPTPPPFPPPLPPIPPTAPTTTPD